MALDFSILGDDGAPQGGVELSPALHPDLMEAARANGLRIIQRFDDYYEDSAVAPDELAEWLAEVAALRNLAIPQELLMFLGRLDKLIRVAAGQGKAVVSIAD